MFIFEVEIRLPEIKILHCRGTGADADVLLGCKGDVFEPLHIKIS
jgi:hypothetical protein